MIQKDSQATLRFACGCAEDAVRLTFIDSLKESMGLLINTYGMRMIQDTLTNRVHAGVLATTELNA